MSITPYDDSRVYNGLVSLLIFDHYLLQMNLSERSITHKLAEHYQHLFHEWNVDCEYNRNLDGPKEILIDPRKILQAMANKLEESGYLLDMKPVTLHDKAAVKLQMKELERQLRDKERLEYSEELGIAWFILTLTNGRTIKKAILPDIIVHRRGTQNNHIIIEVKKSINTDIKDRAYDLIKLMTLVSSPEFKYERGYFIDIPVGDSFNRFKRFYPSKCFVKDVYKIEPSYIKK